MNQRNIFRAKSISLSQLPAIFIEYLYSLRKAHTACPLTSFIPVNVRLVCFKFVDLTLFHLLAVVMAFYGQRAVDYRNIFSRPLAVASTGVYTARLYVNPVDSTDWESSNGKQVKTLYCPPVPWLESFFRLHQTEIHTGSFN